MAIPRWAAAAALLVSSAVAGSVRNAGVGSSMLPAANITFRWAYFPTHDAMRFVLFNNTPGRNFGEHYNISGATHWSLSLSSALEDSEEGERLARANGALPVATSGHTWAVPTLQPGEYLVTVQLSSGSAVVFSQTDTLNRTVRPWESNTLGMDDIVIPPFTALNVAGTGAAGTKVRAVARELTLTDMGLWSQVAITPPATPREPKPAAIDVLAKPIELVATIGGKVVVAAGKGKITKSTPTSVETTSSWSAGPLSGSLATSYEQDGCMKTTLTLQPSAANISGLALHIPLKLSEAPFMHAVTDLLRMHYAGRIPPGEGEVYNTSAIPRFQLPGPFVPYIWVGGAARGIAFFADNDKDWISGPLCAIEYAGKRPCPTSVYQLLRDSAAGTLTLVVNLINPHAVGPGGTALTRTRTIEFGLMASPAKPQAAAPTDTSRDWWLVGGATENQVSLEFLGADYYWGSQTPCLQYYPFLQDYSVYDWLVNVRTTGLVGGTTSGPNGTIPMDRTHNYEIDWIREKWMPLYTPENCKSCTAASLWNVYESIQYSANQMVGNFHRENISTGPSKGVSYVVPYTNARGVVWDTDTAQFMDEWTEYDVADPRWWVSGWGEMLRFDRKDSPSLTHNASVGLWAGYAYQTDPVKSYADMALHYTRKMLETFADGIYYDDVFLEANFNPAPAGPGYVDDDGTLRAGVGIWAWREFLKRSAIMQHTIARFKGTKPTVLYIHMTNVNMIPLLSWGSVNLDWEWRCENGLQDEDVQTRNNIGCDDNGLHCNDTSFILAQTTGLQAGNIPIAISSGLTGTHCTSRPDLYGTNCTAWLMKTQYATCIPHEVRPEGTPWGMTHIAASPDGAFEETPTTVNVSTVLDVYGYGDPTCDVYRFWEDPFPIDTSGANVLPLIVHCPASSASAAGSKGHVLIFFGSFGPKGVVSFKLSPTVWPADATTVAMNAETGEPIERTGQNFTVSVDKHSFKMVVLKTDDA